MKKAFSILMLLVAMLMAWPARAQQTLIVADGTATNSYVPLYGFYADAYLRCQIVYPSDSLVMMSGGQINGLTFYASNSSVSWGSASFQVKIGETTASTLSGSWDATTLTTVYTGSLSITGNQMAVTFTTPYNYTGGNLLIEVNSTSTGSYVSCSWYGISRTGASIQGYDYSDWSSVTPTSRDFLPKTAFNFAPGNQSCPWPFNLAVSGIDSASATLTWSDTNGATNWRVFWAPSDSLSLIDSMDVTDTTYTFYGLDANTAYTVSVMTVCDTSNSIVMSTSFRTGCGVQAIPYSTGFEGFSSGATPFCWQQIATGTSGSGTFPSCYNYSTNAHSGSIYYEFESTSGQTEIAALPVMDNISMLRMSFYAACTSTNFVLEAGVMEDTDFVLVDTVHLSAATSWGTNAYRPYTVYFNDYYGNGTQMALRVTGSGSYTLMIDDIMVDPIPNCIEIENLHVASISTSGANITWREVGSASAWEILYDTLNFNPDTSMLTAEYAYDTNYFLPSLGGGLTHYVYVRADCGGEYSAWVGPLTFVPGRYVFGISGVDTLRACGAIIYDDGGPTGSYSSSCDYTLVVYPSSNDSLIVFWGTFSHETCCDHLSIYDGVGTGGTLLSYDEGTIPVTRSASGPITIKFTSDGSVVEQGFAIHVACEPGPQCAYIHNLRAAQTGTASSYLTWGVTGTTYGIPEAFDYECIDTASGSSVAAGSTSDYSLMVTGLTPQTGYLFKIRTECESSDYGAYDSIFFTTGGLPCAEYDTSATYTLTLNSGTAGTSYYIPVGNYYNYSYTQELILASELNGAGSITGIDFQYNYSSASTVKTNCTIYLANTTVSSLSSSFVPYSSAFVPVYVGPLNCSSGWNHFEFTDPFNYDGSSNLLIVVHDNSGDYNGSSYTFNTHATADGRSRYVQNDNSPYSITSVSGGSSLSYTTNMKLHFSSCDQLATCAAPNVVVNRFTSDTVELLWGPGYMETSWEVEYRAATDTAWTYETTAVTGDYTFSGLTPNTTYQFRISTDCGDTIMSSIVELTTACAAYSLPFTYGFEGFPTSSATAPNCWYKKSTYSSTYPYASNSYAHSGSYSCYFYNYNSSSYGYLVLPILDAPIDTLEMTVWMLKTNTSYTHELAVGVMTDPEDFSTFTQVGIITPPAAINTWGAASVRFNTYVGTGSRIAIASTSSGGTYCYPYIDDITVDIIRPCDRPEHVTATYITTDSAILVWDSSSASDFEVKYGIHNFMNDSTLFRDSVVVFGADSVLLAGLTPNTPYDVYVRSLCMSGDTSSWSLLYSFRTNCIEIDSLPFFDNLESYIGGTSSANSDFGVYCWNRYTNATSYWYPFLYNSTSYNHTPGGNKGFYWYVTSTTSYGTYQIVALPRLDTIALPINTLQLSFWAKASSSSYTPYFQIGVMTDDDESSFIPVDTLIINGNTTWTLYDIPFTNFTGSGNRLAIRSAYSMTNDYWYAYLDDFTIDLAPTCPHVGNLHPTANTFTTCSFAWTERGTATEWQTHMDVSATATPTGDSITNTPGITYTGLTAGTNYYYWVRPICTTGDTGAWEGPLLMVPGTWNMRANMTDTVRMCGGVIYDDGGPSGAYSHSQTSTLIIYPDSPGALLVVQGTYTGEGCCDYLGIYDGAGTSGTQFFYGYSSSSGTTMNLGPYTSTSGPITIHFTSDGSVSYDGLVLNVSCQTTHCLVTNLHLDPAVPASASQLALTWDTCGAVSYQVEYGAPNFTLGTGTQLTTYTNSVIISGLTGLTNYEVYVRAICGVGDTGDWQSGIFRTELCDNVSIAQSWDSTWSANTNSYVPMGYSTYNYSYIQTIIDSARFANFTGDITAFAFKPSTSNKGDYYNHISVFMANVPESDLSAFILPDSNHVFVPVITDADMRYSDDNWQLHGFDTAFTWDGHSNVLFVVKRDHGSWSSGASFQVHSAGATKSRYLYQDSGPYNPSSVSGGTGLSVVGDLLFYSCGASGCMRPTITSTTGDYQSATMTWSGTGNAYEVAIKAVSETAWPAETPVAANTYTFTGLQPATAYQLRVRQDCSVDSLGYSDWAMTTFVTDSLPCLSPDSVTVSGLTNATGTFAWTVLGNETAWDLHVWNTTFDTVYTHVTNPVTVGGFTAGVTYNAAVRALCGTAQNIEGLWSDTVQFTTAVCATATGLTAGNVTYNSVTLSWNAVAGAIGYSIMVSSGQTSDSVPMVTATSYVYTGLESETQYHFYVRTICGTGWRSETSAEVYATTADEPDSTFTITAVANNATYGYVTGGGSYQSGDVATLTATAYTGYSFSQWNDGVTTNPRSVTVTGDATYTAIFTVNQYTVTVNSANPTMGSVSGGGSYAYNSTATLTATANPGYHFTQWNDGDTHAVRVITVTSDTVFTAAFAVDRYTVTVTSNNPAWGSVSGGGEYDYNATATLTATPNANYYFIRWSDGNTSNPRSLLVTGDITLEAIFSDTASSGQTYTLTLSVNDPAMGSLSNYGGTYAEGTTVPVSATANVGYHFVNWSDNSTENPRTFVMTSDITMTANFAQDIDSTAVLTVSVNGNGFVTVNGAETSTYRGRLGDVVTLVATAYEGNVFAGWSDGSTEATRSYTLTENNATLTANFTVGIAEVGVGSAAIAIYPNPAKGSTTVSVTGLSGKVRIAVLDLSGREVLGETVECGAECEKSLDIEGLAGGAYFVRVTSEAGAPMVKKLIVR